MRSIRRNVMLLLFFICAFELFGTDKTPYRLFPSLYRKNLANNLPQSVDKLDSLGGIGLMHERLPILANNTVVAFYGHPLSKRMGILGLHSKEDIASMVRRYSSMYDAANGPTGVVSAYYIIYGTCWPGGEIGYLRDSVLEEYIQYAQSQNMLVFVDHQIGKYTVQEAMERILPFLKYPNVHLAIDPEWRTLIPMKEIGSISGDELNQAQGIMNQYIIDNGISGIRMLVVHQFHEKMIRGREKVRADYERVLLVHTADGFGSPALKKNTYSLIAKAENLPMKGFKLFFKSEFPLAGFDDPLMRPEEVMALDPRPVLIMYQ